MASDGWAAASTGPAQKRSWEMIRSGHQLEQRDVSGGWTLGWWR